MTQTLSHTIKSKTNKQDETANLNEIKTSLNSEGNSIELKMIQMLSKSKRWKQKKQPAKERIIIIRRCFFFSVDFQVPTIKTHRPTVYDFCEFSTK